ncbi:MAG: hypothetical protein N4J56_007989 [Chroococcidiopsis sp. SAG 2025]|uniref:TRAFAC clade GTPase domain-containing protein n=1 Tax=Chroococcidiopsis sp. SAG 2025 TaxID=171389 RepID=UPI002936D944|nr:SH3 domain-containing protein [Chroococcidiopsis sp. SAG 2025]MDV2998284.1 hypothetical protein [Chroococcidiopsis sp. SAG 2025]
MSRYNSNSSAGCLGSLIVTGIVICFFLTVIYYVLSIAFWIALTIAGLASIWGVFIGIKNFALTVKQAHQTANLDRYQGEEKYKTEPIKLLKRFYKVQPAKLLYVYDAGWYVMDYVSKNVWQSTKEDASKIIDWGKDKWAKGSITWSGGWLSKAWACLGFYAPAIGLFIGGGFHFVAALAIVAIFLALQFVFLAIGVVVTSVIMTILGAGTYLYGKFYGVYYRCPSCHEQMKIPAYTCNKCSQEHDRLWPSVYGVLRHTCRGNLSSGDVCNRSLPTLSFLGRDKLLEKKCPHCSYPLQGVGGTNAHIPIVGGPYAGKSNYIVMATKQLIDEYAPAHNLEVTLPDEKHRNNYEASVDRLNSGQTLLKTSRDDDSAKAFNIEVNRTNQAIGNLLYVYDAAGEHYTDDDSAEQQKYFKYVHGILLIIDPFSIHQVHEAYKNQLHSQAKNIAPSNENLNAIYERVLSLFETKVKSARNSQFSQPIAVIVTKTDLGDLEQKIGSYAAREYMAKNSTVTSEQDAINALVEEFLNDYGEGNFVRNLRSHFSNIKFFSCSALGFNHNAESNNDATFFDGFRVLDPMLWLMEQTKTLPDKASLLSQFLRSKPWVKYGLPAITTTVIAVAMASLAYGGYSLFRLTFKQLRLSSIFEKNDVNQNRNQSSSVSVENNLSTEYKSSKLKTTDIDLPSPTSIPIFEKPAKQFNSTITNTNATVTGSPGTKNIRSGPGTNYGVVGKISTGDRVQTLSQAYDSGGYLWYQVYYPPHKTKGWIARQLIKTD